MKKILGVFLTTILIASFAAPVYADELNPTIPQPTDYPEENKPLVITPADKNLSENANEATDRNTDEPDTTAETEMWPVYLSFGALGAAVLVFVVLNLFGNKK